uniref:Uncharacterized protein n=1 Tax=Arundo donax TaxID=35708 RepID=A0A0A9AUZ0_ARUDO
MASAGSPGSCVACCALLKMIWYMGTFTFAQKGRWFQCISQAIPCGFCRVG